MEAWNTAHWNIVQARDWAKPLAAGAAVLLALVLERGAIALLRAFLGRRPLSGEAADCRVYHRNPWALDRPAAWAVLAATVASGLLAATAMAGDARWWAPALLLWLGALALDLQAWDRVACGMHTVAWRRGWRKPRRRLRVAELRGVRVTRGHAWGRRLPAWLQPGSCRLSLELADGSAVELPRTGHSFGGRKAVQEMAAFLRLQIEDHRSAERQEAGARRAAAHLERQAAGQRRQGASQAQVSTPPVSIVPWADFGAEPQ